MKTLTVLFLGLVLGLSGCETMQTKTSDEKVLNATQVKQLFSGKTAEYRHERKDFDVVAYYAPDGSLRGQRGPKKVNNRWSVNSAGELCIHKPHGDFCRIVVKQDGVYKKYKIKGNGDRLLVVTYHKFIDGNPHGF